MMAQKFRLHGEMYFPPNRADVTKTITGVFITIEIRAFRKWICFYCASLVRVYEII